MLNRRLTALCLGLGIGFAGIALAADAPTQNSLDDQLKSLDLPSNQAPAGVTEERLYSVQSRYSPLAMKSEVFVGFGKNFTPDGLLNSNELEFGYRLNFTDRWSLGVAGSSVYNSMNAAGIALLRDRNLFGYAPYVNFRTEATVGFNAFYGKLRLGLDSVTYFDQYWSLGAGWMGLNYGHEFAAVGDVGFVFWLGKMGSVRIGLKDYLFREERIDRSETTSHLIGHVDVGFMFGGKG